MKKLTIKDDKEYAIEIEHLQKYYKKRKGVDDISLKVKAGEIYGFLGPNGAGKSTTIRCMLGLIQYQKGNIKLLGNKYHSPSEIRAHIGYMPSETMFYPTMKVRDIIQLAADARKLDCKKEGNRLCEILEVPLEKKVEELSLGNRKKVSIICALQHKPELLILDEPTSGLDPLMQETFFGLLKEANQNGTTCFLSSHVLSEVKKYCTRAAIIKNGCVLKEDSIEKLSHTNLRFVKIWHNNKVETFSYTGSIKELIHKLDGQSVDDVLIEEPSLDELFIHYYDKMQ